MSPSSAPPAAVSGGVEESGPTRAPGRNLDGMPAPSSAAARAADEASPTLVEPLLRHGSPAPDADGFSSTSGPDGGREDADSGAASDAGADDAVCASSSSSPPSPTVGRGGDGGACGGLWCALALLGELCFYACAVPAVYLTFDTINDNVQGMLMTARLSPEDREEHIAVMGRSRWFYAFERTVPWGPVGSLLVHPLILACFALWRTLLAKRRALPTLNAFWRTYAVEVSSIASDAMAALRFPFVCSRLTRRQRILGFTQGMQLFMGYVYVYGYLSPVFNDLVGPGFISDVSEVLAGKLTAADLLAIVVVEQTCSVALNLSFHRFFAHQSFETSRAFRLVLALYGCMSTQRGALWWASTHRLHHVHCDSEDDPHSRRQHGFVYSHCGWFFQRKKLALNMDKIPQYHESYELVRRARPPIPGGRDGAAD